MIDKLNFYDLVSFLIPGGMVLGFFYWFCVGFIGLPLSIDAVGLGGSILLVGLAYLAGHVIQALGNRIEKKEQENWGGFPSAQFIKDEDPHYTPEFKQQLKSAVEKTFGLQYSVQDTDQKVATDRGQELFNLCYTLLVQEQAAKYAEIFNGTYSLYRGALAALRVGITISVLFLVKEAALGLLALTGIFTGSIQAWTFEWVQLISASLGLTLSWAAQRLLNARFKRFGRHFADSIYRSFYVWFKLQEKESKA